MKKLILHLPWIAALVIIGLFLTRNLWATRAWIETHDGIYHLVRQEVFTDALKEGNFPVRWAGSLDNGFGVPLFNYVYPGPYYLGAPLSLLGLSSKLVIKIVEIGLYLLGAVGMYALFAKQNKLSATISAILYMTTPYLLLNIFIRGALGEFMAISCIPWALLALSDLAQKKAYQWYHPLPYFFIFIAHNFLSFLFLPIYLLIAFLKYKPVFPLILKTLLLSLTLASFFVLPMLLERTYLYSFTKQDFTYSLADHFIYPVQLVIGKWGNGFSYPGTQNDGFSFALGLTTLVVLLGGGIQAFRTHSRDLRIWMAIAVLVIFFFLPYSLPIWNLLTPLQVIQFPWRLLSLLVVAVPIIAFYLVGTLKSSRLIKIVTTALVLTSLYFGYRYTTPFYFQNNTQLLQQLYLSRQQTTTSSRYEILPKWGSIDTRWIGDEDIRIAHGSAEISAVVLTSNQLTFTADSNDPNTIYRIRRNYFPSWRAKDEEGNRYQTTVTDDGLIDFVGSTGTHTYTAYVGSTPVESFANLLSLLTLLYLLGAVVRPKVKAYIDDRFEHWDISIALRYLPIVDALKKNTKPSDKILEVGSEISGITTYYPRTITGLDQGFDYQRQNKYLKPVEGSAVAMPFKDKSFQYVISVDCLEHIPPKLRAKAVGEMLRVAAKQIYLTFPVGPHSQSIDKMLDQYFYEKNGEHFTYLTEHVDNGLPGFDFIPKIVAKHKGWQLQVQGNTSTWLWVILLKMGFSNIQWQTSIYRRLLLLLPLIKHCNFGQCYRELYILTRTKS